MSLSSFEASRKSTLDEEIEITHKLVPIFIPSPHPIRQYMLFVSVQESLHPGSAPGLMQGWDTQCQMQLLLQEHIQHVRTERDALESLTSSQEYPSN